MPEWMALAPASAEVALPLLLVLGLCTRYAALGLLAMTAVIQLTYPDGWQNFHLPWAAMALAILTFGAARSRWTRRWVSTACRGRRLQ